MEGDGGKAENPQELIQKKKEEILKEVYVEESLLEKILSVVELIRGKVSEDDEGSGEIIPRGILFYGPPGTGKTKLMRVLCEVLEIPHLEISGPEILSEYYGKSERNLRKVFRNAKRNAEEKGMAIIFIDELDAIAPRRDVEKAGPSPRLVGQLLALMDGLSSGKERVLIIGSTNRPWAIDPALRRPGRFDYEFEFELPNEEGRKKILEILLRKVIKDGIKIEEEWLREMARRMEGFSGADIRLLVMEAVLTMKREKGKDPRYGTKEIKDLKRTIEEILHSNKITPTALREMAAVKISPKEEGSDILSDLREDVEEESVKKILFLGSGKLAEDAGKEIAQILANKLKEEVYFIRIPCSIFRTKWFGEGERMLRDHLDRALKLKPSVILLDHMDSISLKEDYNLAGMISELLTFLDRIEEMEQRICIGAIRKDAKDKISLEIRDKFDKIIELKKESDKTGKK